MRRGTAFTHVQEVLMLTLYYAPHTCSLASHIALIDAGAAYELKRIDFGKTEQKSPNYLAINPKARVPAMLTPGGILTETPAILAFVAQSFPEARLAPLNDPFAFAELQSFNSYLCSTLHVAHAHRMRGHRWAGDPASFADMQRKVPQSAGACYELIESCMLKGPWVMGDAYTIADPYFFTVAQWFEDDGVVPDRVPRVIEHRSRMLEMPAVKIALAEELAD
jgi:glutathione S-transferase